MAQTDTRELGSGVSADPVEIKNVVGGAFTTVHTVPAGAVVDEITLQAYNNNAANATLEVVIEDSGGNQLTAFSKTITASAEPTDVLSGVRLSVGSKIKVRQAGTPKKYMLHLDGYGGSDQTVTVYKQDATPDQVDQFESQLSYPDYGVIAPNGHIYLFDRNSTSMEIWKPDGAGGWTRHGNYTLPSAFAPISSYYLQPVCADNDGYLAYINTGYQMVVLDISTPTAPTSHSSLSYPYTGFRSIGWHAASSSWVILDGNSYIMTYDNASSTPSQRDNETSASSGFQNVFAVGPTGATFGASGSSVWAITIDGSGLFGSRTGIDSCWQDAAPAYSYALDKVVYFDQGDDIRIATPGVNDDTDLDAATTRQPYGSYPGMGVVLSADGDGWYKDSGGVFRHHDGTSNGWEGATISGPSAQDMLVGCDTEFDLDQVFVFCDLFRTS